MRRLALLALLGLGGCSLTLPVAGRVEGTNELLVGSATGYIGGSGDLTVTASGGRTCTGKFQYASGRRSGTGTFLCSDGSHGPFAFTSTGQDGTGFGTLNTGERFRFVFGSMAAMGMPPF